MGLGPAFARRAFLVAVGVAVLASVAAAFAGLPAPALALLAVIVVAGVAYSLGPRLAWRGFGEVTNSLLGGFVLPLYGVAAVGVVPDVVDALTFLPFTAVVFANLLATQWPDRRADEHVGKNTLAVTLNAATLRALYGVVAVLGLGLLAALAASALVPWALVALAVPTAALLAVGTRRYGRVESPAVTVHAMVVLAFVHVLVAACLW